MIRITINTENQAFLERPPEVARILHKLADRIKQEDDLEFLWNLFDINGNVVGEVISN